MANLLPLQGIYDPDDDSTRDPRLTYTLMTKNGDTYDGKVSDAWWSWNSPFQLFMRKYQNQPTTWTADNQDMYVIRYADVLLMRAEALAKAKIRVKTKLCQW